MLIEIIWAVSVWINSNTKMVLVINIFNIYYLFLSKRHTLHLTNFMDSGSITPRIIAIILTKILYLRWFKHLYYLIKKLSLSLEILGIMACLGLILELALIRSF